MSVGGTLREAVIRGVRPGNDPLPLVILFHGYGDTGRGMEVDSGFSRMAASGKFVAVYPTALGSPPSWQFTSDQDLRFISDLLSKVEEGACIDLNRVFAVGMSMGGGMAAFVGCRLSDRISAVASVAGTHGPKYEGNCVPRRPVAIVTFHSLTDPVVPYGGGPVDGGRFSGLPAVAPIDMWMAAWAARNGCQRQPSESSVGASTRVFSWQGCRAEVVLYQMSNGGHLWPGSRADAQTGLPASDLIWTFFSHLAPRPSP
jgi:polyhydroxybutyrate depolymerase